MAKLHVICAVLSTLLVVMVQTAQDEHSASALRWVNPFGLGREGKKKPKFSLSCQLTVPFQNDEKAECTLSAPVENSKGTDDDVTIEVACGEDTKCSYTGKPGECKKIKSQKKQIPFYLCIAGSLNHKKACEAEALDCKKTCKGLEFKKAEMNHAADYAELGDDSDNAIDDDEYDGGDLY